MRAAASDLFKEGDRGFGVQRMDCAATILRGSDGDVVLRPGCGGLMGDRFAVNTFVRTFLPPVSNWCDMQRQWDPHSTLMRARCPITRQLVDLSLTKYADDLTKKLSGHTAMIIVNKSVRSNQELDTALADCGFRQNLTKQDTLLSIRGPGAGRDLREVRDGLIEFPGKAALEIKSLGFIMSSSATKFGPELKSRGKALQRA
eukprot:9476782-Pyramimonas_sp.AAC.1